jgi:nucleotide-binding universal stress UspA family protein
VNARNERILGLARPLFAGRQHRFDFLGDPDRGLAAALMWAPSKMPSPIRSGAPLTVKDLSAAIGVRIAETLMVLMRNGIRATVNAVLDRATVELVCHSFEARAELRRWDSVSRRAGDPEERMLELLRVTGADLVAVPGESIPVDGLPGKTAVPVLAIPQEGHRRGGRRETNRILLPLDGSPRSAGILPLVTDLARAYDAEVVVLHVVRDGEGTAADSIQASVAELEARGIKVSSRIETGDPARVVLSAAVELSPRLVALTVPGEVSGSPGLLDPVVSEVVRGCPVPFLLYMPAPRRT